MGGHDAIQMTIDPRERRVGSGTVRRVLPFAKRRMVGPFIFADLIGPEVLAPGTGVDVNAHPHIGLSTLTYLLAGRLVHRDSTGAVATIEPGAVNWMTAGAGVTHTERSHPDDRPLAGSLFGLQTWVALPDGAEDGTPHFVHQPQRDAPEEHRGSARIRLAVGTGFGMAAPTRGSSPLILAELALEDALLAIDDEHPERAVLVLDGQVAVGGTHLKPGQLAVLDRGPAVLSGTGRAMILGGEPVGPRYIWWNFVHSDRERIDEAKTQWQEQRFPAVPGDHEPWVPLPAG